MFSFEEYCFHDSNESSASPIPLGEVLNEQMVWGQKFTGLPVSHDYLRSTLASLANQQSRLEYLPQSVAKILLCWLRLLLRV
jgi:hypothetical protein